MTHAYDPDLLPYVELMSGGDLNDVAATRKWLDDMAASGSGSVLRDPSVEVRSIGVPGPAQAVDVLVRVHTPPGRQRARPALLYIHGGAFVVGSAAGSDIICSQIAAQVDAVVIAVDYRLAPEDPFPAGLEDCYAALIWVHQHCDTIGVDPHRIAVGGESAGAGLAAALALLARDRGGPVIAMQMLITPEIDDRLETLSMRTFTDTPGWARPNAILSWSYYLNRDPDADNSGTSPYAAPARAQDLGGLPPTYLTAYEFDPLRDEDLEYGNRLIQAGVPTEMHLYPSVFHGCTNVLGLAITERIVDDMMGALIRAFRPSRLPAAVD